MSGKAATNDLFSQPEETVAVPETGTDRSDHFPAPVSSGKGIQVHRYFSEEGIDPLESIEFERRTSRITEPSGEVVFELKNLEVPKSWSQLATDILASKYCRRAGVPKTGYEVSA